MHVNHFGAAAVLLAAGAITVLATTGAANADAPRSPQDVYGSCIQEQIEQHPQNPNLDVIQGACCAQAGGTPSYTPNGKFLNCALTADSSGHRPNPPKPGTVVIVRQLPNMTHV